jgi:hypothetical protein
VSSFALAGTQGWFAAKKSATKSAESASALFVASKITPSYVFAFLGVMMLRPL